jgi:hypothetical protein
MNGRREKPDLSKCRKPLRSPACWVITAVAVLLGALVHFYDRLGPGELLVAGAAFPAPLKKLVAARTLLDAASATSRPRR